MVLKGRWEWKIGGKERRGEREGEEREGEENMGDRRKERKKMKEDEGRKN